MSDLSPQQQNSLSDMFADLSSSLSLALSEQINQMAVMEQPRLQMVAIVELLQQDKSSLCTTFSLSPPMDGESVLQISEETACVLADLIAGNAGTSPPETLDDKEIGLLTGAMGGVVRGLATALSNRTGDMIDVENSNTHLGALSLPPGFALADTAAQVTLNLSISEVLDTEIVFLFTPETIRALFPETESGSDSNDLSEDDLARMLGEVSSGMGASSAQSMDTGGVSSSSPFSNMLVTGPEAMMPRGMDLILDIPLEVTVELGRVRMLIKDVLELGSGSIVELDRVAGEPVDLLVNGRLIAKGEVVVIEDNFGIRVTEIVSPADRLAGLGKGR